MIMPDLMRIGGVSGWLKTVSIAEAFNIEVSTHLYPEVSDDRYRYFPSTAGTQCSYRVLTPAEKATSIGNSFKICLGDELVTRKHDCFGWN